MSQPSTSPSHPVRLELEPLEERCVLSTAAFVTTLYVDLLHRIPAASEMAGWVRAVNIETLSLNGGLTASQAASNGGLTASQAATAFTTSSEYLNDTVQASYQLYLNRAAAPAEAAPWTAALQNGLPQTQFQAAILASDEFFAQSGGSAYPWLNAVYQKALGRLGAGGTGRLESAFAERGVAAGGRPGHRRQPRGRRAAGHGRLPGPARPRPDPAGLASWIARWNTA